MWCFIADNPRQWSRFLPWAEWHYNTAWHSTINLTPFEAVFGRSPPLLTDYLAGGSTVASVDELLTERATILHELKENLHKAQLRMRNHANLGRTDAQFWKDDWVMLKLQPFCQTSLR